MFDDGFFGGLFDLDDDGKLDFDEQMLDTMALFELMEESEDEDESDSDLFDF